MVQEPKKKLDMEEPQEEMPEHKLEHGHKMLQATDHQPMILLYPLKDW